MIYGELSRSFELDVYQKPFPGITQDSIVEIKGAGHWAHFEKQGEVLAHIDKFYKSLG